MGVVTSVGAVAAAADVVSAVAAAGAVGTSLRADPALLPWRAQAAGLFLALHRALEGVSVIVAVNMG